MELIANMYNIISKLACYNPVCNYNERKQFVTIITKFSKTMLRCLIHLFLVISWTYHPPISILSRKQMRPSSKPSDLTKNHYVQAALLTVILTLFSNQEKQSEVCSVPCFHKSLTVLSLNFIRNSSTSFSSELRSSACPFHVSFVS